MLPTGRKQNGTPSICEPSVTERGSARPTTGTALQPSSRAASSSCVSTSKRCTMSHDMHRWPAPSSMSTISACIFESSARSSALKLRMHSRSATYVAVGPFPRLRGMRSNGTFAWPVCLCAAAMRSGLGASAIQRQIEMRLTFVRNRSSRGAEAAQPCIMDSARSNGIAGPSTPVFVLSSRATSSSRRKGSRNMAPQRITSKPRQSSASSSVNSDCASRAICCSTWPSGEAMLIFHPCSP